MFTSLPFLYGPNVPVARLQELQVLLHGWQCHGLNEFLRGERTIAVVVHQAEELLPKQGTTTGEWPWAVDAVDAVDGS